MKLTIAFFGCVMIFFLSTTAWSTTYYVSQEENSKELGTESDPWSTIGKAASVANAGDTVYVKDGIYEEWVDVKYSGEEGMPITFKAYPGHLPIIDGSNVQLPDSWKALFHSRGNNHITVDGFEVRNTYAVLIRLRNGDHLTIRNCIVHDNANADGTDNNHSGIFMDHTDSGLIENNEVYRSGHNAIHVGSSNNVTVRSNYIHDNPNHNGINMFPKTSEPQIEYSGNHIHQNVITGATNGIYCRYQTDNVISNNLIYRNDRCGIKFTTDQAEPHNFEANTKILNNTIVDNLQNGFQSSNASHIMVRNNIIAYNGGYAVYIKEGVTAGTDIDTNLYYSGLKFGWAGSHISSLPSWISISGQDENSMEAKPMFTGRSENDYRLSSESIHAIDKGEDMLAYSISFDIDGITRPQGDHFDIGAYEYLSEDQPATYPPKNLHVE